MEIDHVLIAVTDLDVAALDLQARYGVASYAGGQHPWGTANRIVPLGDTYLELVAVVDGDRAGASTFGRWVASANPGRPMGWAVRTPALDATAARNGLMIASGGRATPNGSELRWRMAGIDQAAAEPSLPFFIEWSAGTELPGRLPIVHPGGSVRLVRVVLQGDAERLGTWLGDHRMPVAIRPGHAAVAQVILDRDGVELLL